MQRILVVDVDPGVRCSCKKAFEDLGFDVRTTSDTASALRIVVEWKPDLAVLDVCLGKESGLDLLRCMLEARPELRTVIASAHTGYKDDFTSWLADAFVDKDPDYDELRRTVRELLEATPEPALAG